MGRPFSTLFLLLTGFSPLSPAQSTPPVHPERKKVVAQVGKVKITGLDLLKKINSLIPLTFFHRRVPENKMKEFRARALRELIEDTLVWLDAKDRKIPVTEKEIRARFQKALARGGERYKFMTKEQKSRMLESLRPLIVRRILIDKNEARFEKGLPRVDLKELKRLFEAKDKKPLAPEEARFLHLFVRVRPTATKEEIEAARNKIGAAELLIKEGMPFREAAKKFSQDEFAPKGGDMGTVSRAFFRSRKLADVAFSLKEGEMSPVIRTIYGFHLIYCVKKLPRRELRFEEVKNLLIREHSEEIRKKARRAWLEEIRKHHPVRILEPDLFAPRGPASRPAGPGKGRGKSK